MPNDDDKKVVKQHDGPGEGSAVGRVEQFLTALAAARKCVQAFPSNNPSVAEALSHLSAATDDFFATVAQESVGAADSPLEWGRTLTLFIDRDAFVWNGERVATSHEGAHKLAEAMYRAGIQAVTVKRGVPFDELRRLVSALSVPSSGPDTATDLLGALAGLECISVQSAAVLTLADATAGAGVTDMVGYFKRRLAARVPQEATSPAEEPSATGEAFMAELNTFFLELAEGSREKRDCLLATFADPKRVASTFSFASKAGCENPQDPQRDTVWMRGLRETFQHVVEAIRGMPAASRRELIGNLAGAFGLVEAETRDYLATKVLIPHAGLGGIEDAVLSSLSDRDFLGLLVEQIRIHKGTSWALNASFQGLMSDPGHRERLRRLTEDSALGLDENQLREVKALLQTTTPQIDTVERAPSARDKATFERIIKEREDLAQTLSISSEGLLELGREIGEEYPDTLRQHAAFALLHAYGKDATDQLSDKVRESLTNAVLGDLAEGAYTTAGKFLEMIEGAATPERRLLIRAALQPVLAEELASETHVTRLLEVIRRTEKDSADHRHIIELVRVAGRSAMEGLFSRLVNEKNRSMRLAILGVFAALKEDGLGFLDGKASHPAWYVARNVAYLVGKTGSQSGVSILAKMLNHCDPRVRMEAVAALGTIGGEAAHKLILQLLGDPEPSVARLAVEWLGHSGVQEALPALRKMLADGKTLRHCHPLALEIVHGIGLLGGPGEIPVLEAAAPRHWIPGSHRRKELAEACAKAVDRILQRASERSAKRAWGEHDEPRIAQ